MQRRGFRVDRTNKNNMGEMKRTYKPIDEKEAIRRAKKLKELMTT